MKNTLVRSFVLGILSIGLSQGAGAAPNTKGVTPAAQLIEVTELTEWANIDAATCQYAESGSDLNILCFAARPIGEVQISAALEPIITSSLNADEINELLAYYRSPIGAVIAEKYRYAAQNLTVAELTPAELNYKHDAVRESTWQKFAQLTRSNNLHKALHHQLRLNLGL